MWALRITMPGASSDEIVRALMAASEVFDKASVTPVQAKHGMERLERWDDRGMKENDRGLRKKDDWRAGLWMKAEKAGMEVLSKEHPAAEVARRFEMSLVDMTRRAPDRLTAIDVLRKVAMSDTSLERNAGGVATLCEQLTENMEDDFAARELMSAVTIAHTNIALAKFEPGKPVEPLRKAMLDAIDKLQLGSA
ncbi:hypothetical protein MAUB1S_11488 [Mycolicibacterium aubagnense]